MIVVVLHNKLSITKTQYMINIEKIEDAVKFTLDGNEETSYPLNEIYFTINKGTKIITFKNINSDRIIVNELIANITVEGNPTDKTTIIQDLNPILYKIGGGGNVDLRNYYTKNETDTLLDNFYDKDEVDNLLSGIGSTNFIAKCPISGINIDTTKFTDIDNTDSEGTTFNIYRNGNMVNMIVSIKTKVKIPWGDIPVLVNAIPEGYRPITTVRYTGDYQDMTTNDETYHITVLSNGDMFLKNSAVATYQIQSGAILNMNITYLSNEEFPIADII